MARKKEATSFTSDDEHLTEWDKWALEEGFGDLNILEKQQKEYLCYSTGSFALDLAIGKMDKNGQLGIPERGIVELVGANGSCKSATADSLMRSVCEADPDNRVIALYAEEPDVDRLAGIKNRNQVKVLSFFDNQDKRLQKAEKQFNKIIEAISRTDKVKLVIIDSVKALCLEDQIYDEKGELVDFSSSSPPALLARLMQAFLGQFAATADRAILVMTNQLRADIKINKFQPSRDCPKFNIGTPGGMAMDHHCTLRIKTKVEAVYEKTPHSLTDEQLVKAWDVTFRLFKHKYVQRTANRHAKSRFNLDPVGFDRASDVLTIASYIDLVKLTNGGVYTFENGDKVRGKENAIQHLREDVGLRLELEKLIYMRNQEVYALKSDDDDE